MSFLDSRFVRVYVVPGAVFQSVIVAGGYGTGRELVEYFTRYGPLGGFLGMGVTVFCISLVLGITYELARVFHLYDYRSFFRHLIGPGWIAFEILYVLMFLLVLAVVASAAGALLRDTFSIPYGIGLGVMLSVVATLVFFGRELVTRALTVWTLVLYGVFAAYVAAAFVHFAPAVVAGLSDGGAGGGWALSGFKYAAYNVSIVPAILFSARAIDTRRGAYTAGVVAALVAMGPALMFHLTFVAGYPEIVEQELPVYWMIGRIGIAPLLFLYVVALFGTFIETGAGFVQGLGERIDAYLAESGTRTLPGAVRAAIAVAGISLSAALASFGLIALIARGYGTIAWAFFAVYVVPVLTRGAYLLRRRYRADRAGALPVPSVAAE